MDVADAKANLAFYERKLAATKARRDECREATQDVLDRLSELVTIETAAPLMLTQELIERD